MTVPGYPLILRLEGAVVLVAGAGRVAVRKVGELLEVGARIRVVAPSALPEIEAWAGAGRVELSLRKARAEDLDGARLAFLATDDPAANEALAVAARARGIPVNRADVPGGGDFSVPARVRRGPITVAISTGGASPRLARLLRERLEGVLDEGWAAAADGLERLRDELQARVADGERRRRFWEVFPDARGLAALMAGADGAVREEVERCLSTLSA